MSSVYVPINCEFHDVLEATAIKRKLAAITFDDIQGDRHTASTRIVDLYSEAGVEFMRLENGSTVRLDHVVSLDDAQRSAFELICALPV
jgi:Rho-binding antiterminator